jgi:hypothetical protein
VKPTAEFIDENEGAPARGPASVMRSSVFGAIGENNASHVRLLTLLGFGPADKDHDERARGARATSRLMPRVQSGQAPKSRNDSLITRASGETSQ